MVVLTHAPLAALPEDLISLVASSESGLLCLVLAGLSAISSPSEIVRNKLVAALMAGHESLDLDFDARPLWIVAVRVA